MKLFNAAVLIAQIAAASAEGFSYQEASGPEAWEDLAIEGNECGGYAQSGIDIPSSGCDVFGAYSFTPGTCAISDFKFSVNNHGVKADYPQDGTCEVPTMKIPGKDSTWKVLQFHIHTSSEHAIDDNHWGAELHVVHTEVGGDGLAVLGFFLEPSETDNNIQFDTLLDKWEAIESITKQQCALGGEPDTVTAAAITNEFMSVYDMVPEGAGVYTYQGSLTTPPCSEIVSWNVVDKPVKLTVRDYTRLVNLILNHISPETCELATVASEEGSTSRPTQPVNGREIKRICPVDMAESSKTEPEVGSTGSSANFVSIAFAIASAGLAMWM